MSTSVPINSFDRGKPFYPLIMNYLVLLIGFKDLAARGGIKDIEKSTGINAWLNLSAIKSDILKRFSASNTGTIKLERQLTELSNGLSKLLGPLELKSEFGGNHIKVEVDDIANDLLYNGPYVLRLTMLSAGSLLILAHECSKGKPWHDRKAPLWEFLRHCRNAAAHGGLFTFQGKEPCNLAEWGHFRIERALLGTMLFKDEKGFGLLSPGDPIRLLWDIEQAYPSMSA
ncbi:MAG: hypothetical protein WBV23_14940 [Desulfobaccales bacterium]